MLPCAMKLLILILIRSIQGQHSQSGLSFRLGSGAYVPIHGSLRGGKPTTISSTSSTSLRTLTFILTLAGISLSVGCVYDHRPWQDYSCTAKSSPPKWGVENSRHYSLREWSDHVNEWMQVTDTRPCHMGPMLLTHINGEAREWCRNNIDTTILLRGHNLPNGDFECGVSYLIRRLHAVYGPLDRETKFMCEISGSKFNVDLKKHWTCTFQDFKIQLAVPCKKHKFDLMLKK